MFDFGMLLNIFSLYEVALIVAGAFIGWHVPQPAWAQIVWKMGVDLLAKAKDYVMGKLIAAKDLVVAGALKLKSLVLPSKVEAKKKKK